MHPLALPLAGIVAAHTAGPAAAGPAITAVITTETHDVDAEGVTRTSRYQERMVRRDDRVWIERVFPPGVAPAPATDVHELNLRVAARSFRRAGDGDGGVAIELVSVADRLIIEVPAESFEDLGLSRRWTLAAELIDRSRLERGAPGAPPAPAGARWYHRATADGHLRVLWSDRFALPLVIESSRRDGRAHIRTTIRPEPLAAGAAAPWAQLDRFARKDLSDLRD